MGKALGITGTFTSILVGAIVWCVLQVIIGVAAWPAIIVGSVVGAVGAGVALGRLGTHVTARGSGRRHRPMIGAH
jgi:hypothetical protein